jgi:hypothetical protein
MQSLDQKTNSVTAFLLSHCQKPQRCSPCNPGHHYAYFDLLLFALSFHQKPLRALPCHTTTRSSHCQNLGLSHIKEHYHHEMLVIECLPNQGKDLQELISISLNSYQKLSYCSRKILQYFIIRSRI